MPSRTTSTRSKKPKSRRSSGAYVLSRPTSLRRPIILAILVLAATVGVYLFQTTFAASQPQVEAFSPTSGDCLAGGQSVGSQTYVAGCNGSAGENWQMTAQTINNPTDHTCLQMGAIPNPDKNTVIAVTAATCNGSAAQNWVQLNGYEMINKAGTNAGKQKCLVDPNTAVSASTHVGAVGCSSAKPQDQLWFNGDSKPTNPPPSGGGGGGGGSTGSAVGQKIRGIAVQFVGHEHESPSGCNCGGAVIDGANINTFTQNHPGEEWCADFVSWVYYKAGYGFGGPGYVKIGFASSVRSWLQAHGVWYARTAANIKSHPPQPGDVMYFNDPGGHVGIVDSTPTGASVTTIDGNYSNGVNMDVRGNWKTNSAIAGWGRVKAAN